jgi:tetratricopeptide (TPR) repeat protein
MIALWMMTPSIRAMLLSFAVVASIGAGAALAGSPVSGDPLHDGIDMYKQQHYDDAVKLFESAISVNPSHPAPHYYLGNCYLAMGKYDLADQSYQLCLKFQPPPDIAAYATKMHKQLQARLSAGGGTAGGAEPGPPPTAMIGNFNQRQFDDEVAKLKKRNHQQLIETANGKIQTLINQIDNLKRNLSTDLESDPLYFMGRRGRQYPNPSGQASQAAAQMKIAALENQILVIKNNVRRDVERMDAQTDNTYAELQTQARATKGSIKPILTSRSIYVRDYVHFTGDDAPPEFIVAPMKLTAGKYTGADAGATKKP